MLPPEGRNGAANLFALIVESELKGIQILAFMLLHFMKSYTLDGFLIIPFNYTAASNDEIEDYLHASVVGTLNYL